MNQITSFLSVIDAFRETRGVSDARVSTLVFNDGGKIKQLREGRDIGVLTSIRAFQWLSDHWPEGAVWPDGVYRPPVTPEPPPAPYVNPDAGYASGQHYGD